MKIYTKTGDQGTTALFGGARVSKDHIRIDAYGTVDELNAWIGVLRDQQVNQQRTTFLIRIQDRLFTMGAQLATVPGNTKVKIPVLKPEDVQVLEQEIDRMEASLSPMKSFILPGGHISISFSHVARTVCRRAERNVVSLNALEPVDELVIQYLNRLSDYLFVLGRSMAADLNVQDTPWKPEMD